MNLRRFDVMSAGVAIAWIDAQTWAAALAEAIRLYGNVWVRERRSM